MDARTYDEIAARAYRIWETEGRPVGKAEEHWHRAKDEIERESGVEKMAAAVELPTREEPQDDGPQAGGRVPDAPPPDKLPEIETTAASPPRMAAKRSRTGTIRSRSQKPKDED